MRTPDLSRADWHTSKHSQQNGACVEVAALATTIGIRDSKAPELGHLTLTSDAWAALTSQIRAGQHDK